MKKGQAGILGLVAGIGIGIAAYQFIRPHLPPTWPIATARTNTARVRVQPRATASIGAAKYSYQPAATTAVPQFSPESSAHIFID